MKKVKVTKLTSQGQITLNKEIMKELNLSAGNMLEVYINKKLNEIVLKKPENKLKNYIGILKGKGTLTTEKYLKTRKKEASL